MRRMSNLCGTAMVIAIMLGAPANAQVRLFMAPDGAQGSAPSTGNTMIELAPGASTTLMIWMEDTNAPAGAQQLNAYQLILPWFASGGSSGQVEYVDNNPGLGNGNSLFVDVSRPDWVFDDQPVALPVSYNETPPTIYGLFYATIQGFFTLPAGQGIRYLAELDVAASAEACGTFEIQFNLDPNPPPLSNLFNTFGAAFTVNEWQAVTIEVACGPGCQDPCDDGQACTVDDACDGDTCTGTPVDCSGAGDACNQASCDSQGAEGNCDVLEPVKNGSPCEDGDACTTADACIEGTCAGLPVDCSDLDDDCNVGVCQVPSGECEQEPANNGQPCDGGTGTCTNGACVPGGGCEDPCDDGLVCTVSDACSGDACVGQPVDCSASSDDCNEASCDAAGEPGNCAILTPVPDGEPCDGGQGQCVQGECVPVKAPESRVFMALDGQQGNAPVVGPVKITLEPGGTVQVMTWVEDNSAPGELLNAYQLIYPFSATAEAGATGTVMYLDINPGQGNGNSMFVDTGREDWVFADQVVALPVAYNETPPSIFGMFYATIPGLGEDIAGDGILYLLEFDLRASEDACGTFSFAFNLAPDPPPLTTLFDPFGAAFPIELFQPLEINVACEPGCQDPCDDGLACTVDDACDGPECVGQAVDCSGQGVECNVATCDPAGTEGNCDIVTPVEDGTPCDNGQGVCKAGDCVPVEACPPGKVTFLDPPSGVVDARQPHPTGNLEPRLGISALRVEAPAGAEFTDCWNLCETSERGFGPNGIQSVVDNGDGTLTIHLVRVITEGAATTVTYKGSGDSGLFIFHPANANGDQVSNQLDILALVDHLNGVIELPWGLYSSDIAHRGAPSPLSLLALIDLLNGADLQDPWLGTPLPTAGECCTTDEQCADGLFCNGEETCTPGEGCAPGEPPCAPGQACNEKTDSCGTCECETGEDCDDGIPCTVDSCLDCFCANFADDDFCDDGLFCTGEESCDPQENCISSGDPCDPGETCNEKLDICEQPPAPASRVFMAPDGEQGSAPPVGPTKVSVQQGGTVQVMAWVVNTSPPPGGLLNAYQLIFPFSATPQADAKGTVSYVDINPGLGNGDSLFVDQKRPDWVFAYSPVALPVNYNETPPNIFGVFYADIAGYGIDITGQGILYMAEFDLQASADACGTFDFDFNLPPDQPPLTALFTPIGAAYVIQAYQALEINVECGQACVNPCTDDNPCTTGDVCIGELCMGQPVDCSGAAGPCEEAACDPQGAPGNCASVKTLPDGTPCEDEDPCTTGEMCKAGKCQGSSSDCNDADPCTIDSCEDGQCENVDINGLAESCVDDEDCQSLGAPGAICQAGVCACHHDNNLNKLDTLCLDLRNAGTGNAQGKCASQDAECNPGPAPDGVLQCTDDDENPLNGAVCVDQACYAVGEQVVIDIEVGPTSVAACGAQAFLSWDVQALDFIEFEVDPDGETGWTQIVFDDVNEQAGTLDLAVGLPVGTPCNTDNGTVEGGTMARLRFEAIGSCKTAGVAFREHNPRSSVSGSSGNLKIGGCNGEALPSGTDEMLINEAASSWTCPESSSGPPDPGAMTREVLFPPIEVSDPCAQTPPDSADWCEVLYYPACAGDLDCGKGELCIDENDCSRGCVPDEMAEEFDCGGTPCVGFCSLDDCVDGLCTIPRWPGGFDPLEYLNGGGDFFPGLTSIQCSYLDDCGTKAACPVEIRNQP